MDAQTLVTIGTAVFASTGFWSFVQNKFSQRSAESRLIMGLAFAEICRRCEIYIAYGNITRDEFQDLLKYFYTPYRDMGGDGTAERLMEEIKRLPIVTEEEANEKRNH
jgi:hypothetical protein